MGFWVRLLEWAIGLAMATTMTCCSAIALAMATTMTLWRFFTRLLVNRNCKTVTGLDSASGAFFYFWWLEAKALAFFRRSNDKVTPPSLSLWGRLVLLAEQQVIVVAIANANALSRILFTVNWVTSSNCALLTSCAIWVFIKHSSHLNCALWKIKHTFSLWSAHAKYYKLV